jgi:hypothetical protein
MLAEACQQGLAIGQLRKLDLLELASTSKRLDNLFCGYPF